MSDPILGRVMLAFEGAALPGAVARRLAQAPAAGMTVFRHHNVRSAGQLRELTEAFQAAGRPNGGDPLLVAADQEGGQLIALGDGSTAFAGNLALGAIDDESLTERVGAAIGLEARAMGVNVVYAPVLDLATDPRNPALGIRAFGDDPAAVARHGASFVRGVQASGAAATVKHAPGMGHATVDPHHGLAAVAADRAILEAREFVPFRTAIAGGARVAMVGHLALPGVTGRVDLPASLSRAVVTDLLRRDLGFEGVAISDALDMGAIAQGEGQGAAVVAAIRAGIDLLLTAPDDAARDRIEAAVVAATSHGALDRAELAAGDRRIAALRAWIGAAGPPPGLEVVGSSAHRGLAREVAARSITLVRDPSGLVGRFRGGGLGRDGGPLLAVMPRPTDLTPADTSSTVPPGLAAALRRYHREVDEIYMEHAPDAAAIAAVRERVAGARAVVLGTIDAHRTPSQLALVDAVTAAANEADVPVVLAALRGPWDAAATPATVTALATYSILSDSLDALAAVLAGDAVATGRLPVAMRP